ncbi:MAG: glycosyltransferase family A protein, partial [Desulfurococcus sp.]|uniref:glycosyltransferase family 2 protein n=1 Tax=Desulfurococcus sp. TaxID=51678 RepID=UPI0031709121
EQITRPHEVVLVVKECSVKLVEMLCNLYSLPCTIIEQKSGFFTAALNMGRKVTSGDVVLFTDDDVMTPRGWIRRYVRAFTYAPRDIVCISSRDIYVKLNELKILPTADDLPQTKLYRWLIRTWLNPPLDPLKKYRFGVYIDRKLNVVHGPHLPDRASLSLPYRGVNMGFRSEVIDLIEFPEHPNMKRAPGNEQYVGLKLVLNGFKSVYTPSNPVLHIHREESLSRTKRRGEIAAEIVLMKSLYAKLLK